MSSVVIAVLATALMAATDATVVPLSGKAVDGQIRLLTSDQLVVDAAGESRTWSSAELQRVDFMRADSEPPAAAPVVVELLDGSLLAAQQYAVAKSQATVKLVSGRDLNVPTDLIRAVRLRDPGNNASLREQFDAYVAQPHDKDMLVFRRDREGQVVLDALDGVLYDVTDEHVDFEYEGDRTPLKRARVEGLIYYHPPTTQKLPAAICRVIDASGSRWQVRKLDLTDTELSFVTSTGLTFDLPREQLVSLDYTAGNLLYLSDMSWESLQWKSFIESRISQPLLEQMYRPRRDENFRGGPLRVQGQVYAKGLALRSETELSYRLPADFRRLRATVAIDDYARQFAIPGSVQLTILGDDKVLFEQSITSSDDPRALDLDITGVRRLKILVGFGDELDIADYLDLCDARLTK